MATVVDPLVSYVPRSVRLRLATDPTSPNGPALEHVTAVVMFADISGFTPLTRQLAQRGPAGVEELSRVLNDYFGRLLALTDAHGGEAVKLAGDALLAVWTVPTNEDLAAIVCRAGQCALAVLAELNGYDAGDDVRLALHVGVGAGQAMAMHLGGVTERWYYVVAGEPVWQLKQALGQASPGEVVLSREAWALVRERGIGQQLEAGCARLEAITQPLPPRPIEPLLVPAEASTALEAYVPTAIRARVQAGHAGWLAEFRRVSALFLSLLDVDQTTPDTLVQAQAVLEAVEPVFERYEGVIHDLYFDEKGVTLVALFGLPPQAHEDDAARCVQAALTIQAALAALGRRTAVGIATGRAFCGSVGSDVRREYTQVGEVMNLAARLMGSAADTVLCDEATVAAARGRLAFDQLPAIRVKGHAEPVPVHRPRGPVAERAASGGIAADGDQPIVGRAAERALLAEALAGLQAGVGAVVMVEGEAGLGKSRLIRDLLAQAAAQEVTTLVGAADAVEQATPYYAWRPVVSRLLGLDLLSEAGAEARRAHVLAQLDDYPSFARLAPLLSSVVAVDLPDTDLTRVMTGDVRAENTRDLIVDLLRRAAAAAPQLHPTGDAWGLARPHLLVLEDAHWLDSVSWALARRVAMEVEPVLLVLATRPLSEPLPVEYRRLRDGGQTTMLQLESLDAEETEAQVSRRLGVDALPGPVARLIVERAEGNPFYSEELALALRETGVIVVRGDQCQLAATAGDLRTLDLPDTVHGVITSRIDRLAPRQQLALKVASVIGRTFAHRILRDVHPIEADRPHLSAELAILEQHDLTRVETPEPDLAYLFKHAITQESAYSLLPFAQRRELHGAVAAWIERREASDLAPYYPLLAYHWGRADVQVKAIDYLELAGEQALRQCAYQEVVEFCTEAIRRDAAGGRASDTFRRARWERHIGEAQIGLGQMAESREHLEHALALLGRPVPTTRLGLAMSLARQMFRQALHRVWHSRRPGHRHPPSAAEVEATRAESRLTEVLYYAHEMLPTVHSMLRVLNHAEAVEPSPELPGAYAGACAGASLVPLHSLAETYGRLGLEAARSGTDLPALCWVLMMTGMHQIGVGQWARTQAALEEAADIATHLGDWRRGDQCRGLLAIPAFHRGNLGEVVRIVAELRARARQRGDTQMEAAALNWIVEHALAVDTPERAVELAEEFKALAAGIADRLEHILANGLLALARMRC